MWGEPSCRVKWEVGVEGGMIRGTRASNVALAAADNAEVHPELQAKLQLGTALANGETVLRRCVG